MSTVRNKSMNARTFGDPDAHWLKVAHGDAVYCIPSSGYWKFAADHAADNRELYRKISDAIQGALKR